MTSIQERQKEPEETVGVSPVWQQVVSSFVNYSSPENKPSPEQNLADSAAGEKVSLSTPEPIEPSSEDGVSSSLVEEAPVPEGKDPIAKELLKETSKRRKNAGLSETDKARKLEQTDTSKASTQSQSEKKGPEPRAAIPSVQELKATLEHMARPSRVAGKPSSGKNQLTQRLRVLGQLTFPWSGPRSSTWSLT